MEAIRSAIRAEIKLFVSELSTDLERFPPLDRWSSEDREAFASLVVSAMISATEELLEIPSRGAEPEEKAIVRKTQKQILLLFLAVPQWRQPLEGGSAEGTPA